MFPVARGANGQPADPADRGVEHGRARLERDERVRVARAPRVVEVDADRDAELDALADEVAHLARDADADGVGEDDLVRAAAREARRELEHATGVDRALERAAERRPERHGDADPVRLRALDDALAGDDRLLGRGARVPPVELLAHGERVVRLRQRRRREAVVAALVEDEPGVGDALDSGWIAATTSSAPAICGTRAGWTKLTASIRGSPAAARRSTSSARTAGSSVDRVVLEAVARPDVADRHRGAQITPSSRREARSSSASPSSPP